MDRLQDRTLEGQPEPQRPANEYCPECGQVVNFDAKGRYIGLVDKCYTCDYPKPAEGWDSRSWHEGGGAD